MEKKLVKQFKQELLRLNLSDLRDRQLMGSLEEIRTILVDINNMFKSKAKPVVVNIDRPKFDGI